MKILLLCTAYNSLTQHAHVALKALNHTVGVAAATTPQGMTAVVEKFQPDLILCPMLTRIIPQSIWEVYPCIILHPGITGDRGPASLDWAILTGEEHWGVTAVGAAEHVDSGPIWAASEFKMREGSKSSLYRDEVTRAAMKAMLDAVERFDGGLFVPAPLDYSAPEVRGRYRPAIKAAQRQIDWSSDRAETIIRKIDSSDGTPGVLDEIGGMPFFLYGATREGALIGPPGEIIGQRNGAICRAAVDGAVWISHLKRKATRDRSTSSCRRRWCSAVSSPACRSFRCLFRLPAAARPFEMSGTRNPVTSGPSISASTTGRWARTTAGD
jgi:putative two-component system hydrogenase maturation factor HypX/HoxX